MTKNTKIAIAVGSAVLVGLTVFMLIRKRREDDIEDDEVTDTDEDTPVKPQPTTTPTLGIGETVNKAFPLKLGSKGAKVKELQRAIIDYDVLLLQNPPKESDKKLYYVRGKDDGKFDKLTESAVKQILGKKTIDSQADIDKIKNSRNKTNQKRIDKAKSIKNILEKKYQKFAGESNFYANKDTFIVYRDEIQKIEKNEYPSATSIFNGKEDSENGKMTKITTDKYGFMKFDNNGIIISIIDNTILDFIVEINPLDFDIKKIKY